MPQAVCLKEQGSGSAPDAVLSRGFAKTMDIFCPDEDPNLLGYHVVPKGHKFCETLPVTKSAKLGYVDEDGAHEEKANVPKRLQLPKPINSTAFDAPSAKIEPESRLPRQTSNPKPQP